MRIEIWADVVCPWAYIGKRRLEAALAAWDGEPVEVVWQPYRIDPMAPAKAEPLAEWQIDPLVDDALNACGPEGTTWAENRTRVSQIAADEGLGTPFGAMWRADSGPAHRLIALAYEEGGADLQNAVVEEVLKAHFVDARDISDPAVLERVARTAGFGHGGALLAAGGGTQQVKEALLRGKAIGVRTSPTLVAGTLALAGAQHPDAMAAFLRDAAQAPPVRELPEEVRRLRQAESLLDKSDPLGALTLLRPLLAEHGTDRAVQVLAARAYYHSAQLERARVVLERLTRDTPDDAYLRLLLGRTLERQGRDADAAPHLRLAAAMRPDEA
ncbi:DsbA family protein [Streptomyces xiamenensis]|uniref:DsbA family protein n=1 Tax=Streptomyces xiamenensis TaxID=408015 RepID=UPI0036F03C63